MMKIGMEFHIDYAHHLPGHELCGKPHGHTAKIVVEVKASKDFVGYIEDNEMTNYKGAIAIDFKDLKAQVKRVIDTYDHVNLNDFFKYPSSEVTCNQLYNELESVFYDWDEKHGETGLIKFYSVRFYEGHGKYVEITAD